MGNASASLDNSGAITVGAAANASAANATADAEVETGIDQFAEAVGGTSANATDTLTNALGGNITVAAMATANGTTNAQAYATVGDGIAQDVEAVVEAGTANAIADLTNAGTIMVRRTRLRRLTAASFTARR